MKTTKILVPTDLSKLSRSALSYAMEMAAAQKAEVIVLSVIGEEGEWFGKDDACNPAKALVPEQERQLDQFVKENCAEFLDQVEIQQIVDVGVPYKEIVRKAEQEKADMIVMSTHGRTGLEHLMLGSVTEKVLAHAPCPVLSIRPHK
ncbi:MAG TPA: universal stress protein [Candidatus Binatia bacterium]|jgi:nucleotide-binding universal stress UspA family protein